MSFCGRQKYHGTAAAFKLSDMYVEAKKKSFDKTVAFGVGNNQKDNYFNDYNTISEAARSASSSSLHIPAYENFLPDFDSDTDNEGLKKLWSIKNRRQIFTDSSIKSPLEFPRQQNDKLSQPEVAGYVATQKLFKESNDKVPVTYNDFSYLHAAVHVGDKPSLGLQLQRHIFDGETVVIVTGIQLSSCLNGTLKTFDIIVKVGPELVMNVPHTLELIKSAITSKVVQFNLQRPVTSNGFQYCMQNVAASSTPAPRKKQRGNGKQHSEIFIVRAMEESTNFTAIPGNETIEIELHSKVHRIAYQLKTTNNDLLKVSPCSGFVEKASNVVISLTRHASVLPVKIKVFIGCVVTNDTNLAAKAHFGNTKTLTDSFTFYVTSLN